MAKKKVGRARFCAVLAALSWITFGGVPSAAETPSVSHNVRFAHDEDATGNRIAYSSVILQHGLRGWEYNFEIRISLPAMAERANLSILDNELVPACCRRFSHEEPFTNWTILTKTVDYALLTPGRNYSVPYELTYVVAGNETAYSGTLVVPFERTFTVSWRIPPVVGREETSLSAILQVYQPLDSLSVQLMLLEPEYSGLRLNRSVVSLSDVVPGEYTVEFGISSASSTSLERSVPATIWATIGQHELQFSDLLTLRISADDSSGWLGVMALSAIVILAVGGYAIMRGRRRRRES